MANGEPDNGVNGNMDLGRLFELLIRGQTAQQRIMSDMRDSAQRALHMAQTFATGPGTAAQAIRARLNLGGGAGGGGGQGGPGGPPVGMTTIQSLISSHTTLPTSAADWNTSVSTMGAQTSQQLQRSVSRAVLGNWSPYATVRGAGGQGGGQGGGGQGGGYGGGGGGGQMGAGPYGMGPNGLPPSPLYFGGPGSPLGPYGPYGPYGPAGPGAGGGHGGGGGGGQGGGRGGNQGGNGVMGWLGRNVPGASLVSNIFGETRNQRAKNEYYQNVEGGGNFAGFGERMHEEAYAATTSGVFSGNEARTAFKGVTRLGYNGRVDDAFSGQGGRQDALDFTYHAKTSYGASVNESLKNLEVVSKNSTLSLNGLQKALKDVSDTAGRAGVNAQMARAQLMGLVQSGVQAGYGPGAIPTAQNLQMGKSSLGRSFEDIDLTGQMSQQYTYMASSNLGMTYNQYTAMQTTSPLAASQARAGQNLSLLSQIFSQEEVNWIKDRANALGGTLDPNSALSIVPEFLQAFPNHNISVIQQQLSAFGIVTTNDPQKALAYAFNLIAGNNGDLANAQKSGAATSPMSASAAKKASSDSSSGLIKGFTTKIDNGSSTAAKIGGALVGVATGGLDRSVGSDKGDSGAMKAYKGVVAADKGERNPVIENLLQSVKDPDKAKVVVHTASGQRVMSLSDAIKSHSTELSSGSVSFVSGSEKGQSVADVVGTGSVNSSADWTGEASKSSGKTGESLTSWQKDHKTDSTAGTGSGAGANGKVVVDLSDAAKQLLKISSASGIAGANGEGAPPLNSYNWNASR